MFAKKQVPINFIDKIFENMRNLKVVDKNPFENPESSFQKAE